jgi:hypothetical protein
MARHLAATHLPMRSGYRPQRLCDRGREHRAPRRCAWEHPVADSAVLGKTPDGRCAGQTECRETTLSEGSFGGNVAWARSPVVGGATRIAAHGGVQLAHAAPRRRLHPPVLKAAPAPLPRSVPTSCSLLDTRARPAHGTTRPTGCCAAKAITWTLTGGVSSPTFLVLTPHTHTRTHARQGVAHCWPPAACA